MGNNACSIDNKNTWVLGWGWGKRGGNKWASQISRTQLLCKNSNPTQNPTQTYANPTQIQPFTNNLEMQLNCNHKSAIGHTWAASIEADRLARRTAPRPWHIQGRQPRCYGFLWRCRAWISLGQTACACTHDHVLLIILYSHHVLVCKCLREHHRWQQANYDCNMDTGGPWGPEPGTPYANPTQTLRTGKGFGLEFFWGLWN